MDALLRSARTRFDRRHGVGNFAIEGMFKLHGCDSNQSRIKLIKNMLRVKGSVVISHTRMIASNNEMRTAVVFANQCVEDGFTRACIAHSRRVNA